MKKYLVVLLAIVCCGCASLLPPTVTMHRPANEWNYQYVYITPTTETTSVSGGAIGGYYGIYGATSSHSVNPTDIITGHFINKGYIRIADIKPEIEDKTLVINYGETTRGYSGFSRKVGVVIQIVSANTNELVCVCSGEGIGETDAQAIRNAIDICLEAFFNQ